MPHLFHDPEFWVLVAAIIFVAVVWKPARRAVIGSLDARAARIRQDLDEARRLREEAEQMLAEYRRREREGAAEAAAVVAHAKAEAERLAQRAAEELEQALQRRQRLAEERIAQAEAKALDEIRAVAVDVAIAAARQTLVEQLDERAGARLLDAAIAELPQQLH
jgi:F-type H+-transporting ATPase subunit b